MYSQLLEELIDSVLVDGVLTEQKRDIIERRAEKDGEDAEEVIMIVESRQRKQNSQSSNKPNVNIETEKQSQPTEKKQELPQLTVPESVVPQVLKIIKGYNKKAAKWGYELLTYNADSHTVSGSFTPKTEAADSKAGFMKQMKEAYKNGDLDEEWKKILKLCGMS